MLYRYAIDIQTADLLSIQVGGHLFSENAMRTDIYTLDDIRNELINMLCLQYVEKLLKDGIISEKHAEMLIERYSANCTGEKR